MHSSSTSNACLPLLYRTLSDAGVTDLPPRLKGVYRHSWARNTVRARVLVGVTRRLSSAAIPSLVVKGMALVEYYGDRWAARDMYDADLLVPDPRCARVRWQRSSMPAGSRERVPHRRRCSGGSCRLEQPGTSAPATTRSICTGTSSTRRSESARMTTSGTPPRRSSSTARRSCGHTPPISCCTHASRVRSTRWRSTGVCHRHRDDRLERRRGRPPAAPGRAGSAPLPGRPRPQFLEFVAEVTDSSELDALSVEPRPRDPASWSGASSERHEGRVTDYDAICGHRRAERGGLREWQPSCADGARAHRTVAPAPPSRRRGLRRGPAGAHALDGC